MTEIAEALKKGGIGGGSSSNDELKKLIEQEINPDNLKKLNESFAKFNTTIQGLSVVANVADVTNDFAAKTKEASAALNSMKEAYANAAASVQHFNHAAESSKAFQEQIQTLTKNISALNKMYETEVQQSGGHINAMNAFYDSLSKTAQAMQGSVDDAKKTQEQIALLAKNLGSLNGVYGNMLAAMQGRG
jgi:gliding motility-associated protein GldL